MKKFLIAFLWMFLLFATGAAFGGSSNTIVNRENDDTFVNRTDETKSKHLGILSDGMSWYILDYGAERKTTASKKSREYWAIFRKYYVGDNKFEDVKTLMGKGINEELARTLYFVEYVFVYDPGEETYKVAETAYVGLGAALLDNRKENILHYERKNEGPERVSKSQAAQEALKLAKLLGKKLDEIDLDGKGPTYLCNIHDLDPIKNMPWRKDVSCQVIGWDTSEGNREIILTVLYKPDKKHKDGRTETIRVPYVSDKKFGGDTFYKKFKDAKKKQDWIYPKNLMLRVPDGWSVDCHCPGVKKVSNLNDIENSELENFPGKGGVTFDSGEVIILRNTGMTIRPPFDAE